MRHLNNVVFLRYFETARIGFLRELAPEHDPAARDQDDFGLIFAECAIRYRAPVAFDEDVAIECWIGEVRRSAFEILLRMAVEERPAAEGAGCLVGYDYTQGRARPLPDRLRETLEAAAA